MTPLFSIIIPTYNEEQLIAGCLKSIFNIEYETGKFEVIIVDNGSSDRTIDIAQSFGVEIFCDDTKNVSGLRNIGAQHAKGEILAFVDADCIVSETWLRNAEMYFNTPDIAAWGAPAKIPENATWVQKAWYIIRKKMDSVEDVDWLEAMNLFVRKKDFRTIGGFNEKLITCEDVDFCYRIKNYGKIISDENISVVHLGEAATVKEFIKKELWRGKGNLYGIESHGFSLKEIPSLSIPIYFAMFLPFLILGIILTRQSIWIFLFLLFYSTPIAIVIFKCRKKISNLLELATLSIILQVYFVVRTIAAFKGLGKRNRRFLSENLSADKSQKTPKRAVYGVIFDVDGTLYHQIPLRALMIYSMVRSYVKKPSELMRVLKTIKAYRNAQETLRRSTVQVSRPLEAQIDLTVKKTRQSRFYVENIVSEWFIKEPLKMLRFCRRKGLVQALEQLSNDGFILGVYSDYPAAEKIMALGVYSYFSAIVDGTTPSLKGFKPNSNGYDIASRMMGLDPGQIVYIGDRDNVDGQGAVAAGMDCLIIGRRKGKYEARHFPLVARFRDLPKALQVQK